MQLHGRWHRGSVCHDKANGGKTVVFVNVAEIGHKPKPAIAIPYY